MKQTELMASEHKDNLPHLFQLASQNKEGHPLLLESGVNVFLFAADMTNSHPSSYLQLDIQLSLAAKGGLAALQVKALPCTCILDMFSQKFAMILTLNLNQEGSNRVFW